MSRQYYPFSLPYRETISLLTAIGITTTCGFALKKENIQAWTSACATVLVATFGFHFARHTEERKRRDDCIMRIHELSNQAAIAATGKNNEGMSVGNPDPMKASNLYSQARLLLERTYQGHMNCETVGLYLDVLYREACNKYQVNHYEDAIKILLDAMVVLEKIEQSPHLKTITHLFNLRGLIAFIQGYCEPDEEKQKKYFELAERFFKKSYALDSSQNDVGVYLRFLSNNLDDDLLFFSDTVSLDDDKPAIEPHFNSDSFLHEPLFVIYAEGCYREKNLEKAIKFYEHVISSSEFQINSTAIFNSFFCRLRYLQLSKLYFAKAEKEEEQTAVKDKDELKTCKATFNEALLYLDHVTRLASSSFNRYIEYYNRLLSVSDLSKECATKIPPKIVLLRKKAAAEEKEIQEVAQQQTRMQAAKWIVAVSLCIGGSYAAYHYSKNILDFGKTAFDFINNTVKSIVVASSLSVVDSATQTQTIPSINSPSAAPKVIPSTVMTMFNIGDKKSNHMLRKSEVIPIDVSKVDTTSMPEFSVLTVDADSKEHYRMCVMQKCWERFSYGGNWTALPDRPASGTENFDTIAARFR